MFSKKPSIHVVFITTLYLLSNKVRKEGLLAIEMDVECPEDEHSLFARAPELFKYPLHLEFMRDVLRVMLSGNLSPEQLGVFVATAKKSYMEADGKDESLWDCIWAMLYAYLQGNAPQIIAEFGRQAVPPKLRPTFNELEDMLKEARHAYQQKTQRLDLSDSQSLAQAIEELFAGMAGA